ncbi:small integral membrane protein 26-like [Pempheris klunzingeri]|uniref:small integral membrane protein 26-like n=1 Tax=Pempheris klunzingeri TaxID=3127111 RepID=UPI00398042A8
MSLKDVVKWNIRGSVLYALGVWTMVGSYAYLKYTGRYDDTPVTTEEEVQEDPNQVVYETAHTKTIIIYKKDFVPYSTRIYNFIRSFSSEPRSGDSDK